jgi:hypothetical protein
MGDTSGMLLMAMIYFGAGRGVEPNERVPDVKNGGFYHQILNSQI